VCQHYGARSGVAIGGVAAIIAGIYGMRAVRAEAAATSSVSQRSMMVASS
jgi:hypothetical protein